MHLNIYLLTLFVISMRVAPTIQVEEAHHELLWDGQARDQVLSADPIGRSNARTCQRARSIEPSDHDRRPVLPGHRAGRDGAHRRRRVAETLEPGGRD